MKVLIAISDEQTGKPIIDWVCYQQWPSDVQFELLNVESIGIWDRNSSVPDLSSFLQSSAQRLSGHFGSNSTHVVQTSDDVAVAIFKQLEENDVLIVGRHSAEPSSGCQPGSVCQKLFAHSSRSFFIIPESVRPRSLYRSLVCLKDRDSTSWMLSPLVEALLDTPSNEIVSMTCRKGDVVEQIKEYISQYHPDLIVLGKSTNRFRRRNGEEIARCVDLPTLIVSPNQPAAIPIHRQEPDEHQFAQSPRQTALHFRTAAGC